MDINHAKEEYEIQIYQFSIKQMQEDTESIIHKRTTDFISSLFRTLAKRDLINENDTRLVEVRQQIIHNIFIKIKNNVSAIHNKFTEYFTIPDNVILFENIPHEKYCNGNYYVASKKGQIDKLEMELLQMKLFRKKLEVELEYHKEMDKVLVDDESMIRVVKSILSDGNLISECRNEEIMINKLKQIIESLSQN